MLPNYDKWKLSNPRDKEVIIGVCESCNNDIYEGEPFYKTKEGNLHEECLEEFAINTLEAILIE